MLVVISKAPFLALAEHMFMRFSNLQCLMGEGRVSEHLHHR